MTPDRFHPPHVGYAIVGGILTVLALTVYLTVGLLQHTQAEHYELGKHDGILLADDAVRQLEHLLAVMDSSSCRLVDQGSQMVCSRKLP
jgi:hypothetical protein